MLRTGVEETLLERHGVDGDVFPAYDDYCFANVNPTVLSLLGADPDAGRTLPDDAFGHVDTDVDRVVLVFLDGYGWEHWKRDNADVPLLSAFTEQGVVTPLTSIYPSETAAATTTFHTGQQPVEHGVLGWDQYIAELDRVVSVLPFTTRSGERVDEQCDVDKSVVSDPPSLYERATEAGVESRLHQPFASDDPWTVGAERVTYETIGDLGVQLRRGLEDPAGPEYLYGYVPTVDTAAHHVGTEDPRYRADLETVTECLGRELGRVDAGVAEDTLFVLTADHGAIDTVPGRNVDIGGIDGIWEHLRTDEDGDPIPPVGSPRNVHLHLRDGTVDRVREVVTSRFPCRTFTRAEAMERGLFGDRQPSDRFRRRCGDLIDVHESRGVWDEEDELGLVGMHGGLTREEMLVPFAGARLAAL